MKEERGRILTMLSEGKITPEEAERLLSALNEPAPGSSAGGAVALATPAPPKRKLRYLVVQIQEHKKGKERVNIRVPLGLLRAGMKLKGLMPDSARGKVETALVRHGVTADLSDINPQQLEELLEHLGELNIDIEEEGTTVRIYCE